MNIREYINAFPKGQRIKEMQRLAIACNTGFANMKHMVYGIRKVSRTLAIPLEIATNFKVRCHESRPDTFPKSYKFNLQR